MSSWPVAGPSEYWLLAKCNNAILTSWHQSRGPKASTFTSRFYGFPISIRTYTPLQPSSFTPRTVCTPYALHVRLGRPQRQSWHFETDKNWFFPAGIRILFLFLPADRLVSIPTESPQLQGENLRILWTYRHIVSWRYRKVTPNLLWHTSIFSRTFEQQFYSRCTYAFGLILTANIIYRLLFIMQTESVLCEVRVESVLYFRWMSVFKGLISILIN